MAGLLKGLLDKIWKQNCIVEISTFTGDTEMFVISLREPKQKSKTQKRKKVVEVSSSSDDEASPAETEDLFEDPEEAPPKKKSKKGSKSRSSPRKGFNTKVAGSLILFLLLFCSVKIILTWQALRMLKGNQILDTLKSSMLGRNFMFLAELKLIQVVFYLLMYLGLRENAKNNMFKI